MERLKAEKSKDSGGGLYFASPKADYQFISSGSTLLDCVLGGGWPLGRMSNIIGDASTGKTLLAIEACTNFAKQYPKGKIYYRESEAAFDVEYAEALGLPPEKVNFGPDGIETEWNTIEDIFEDLSAKVNYIKEKDIPALYIVDSLDALSDREELKRKIDEGSYAMGKQKKLHQLFRQKMRTIKQTNMHLMIVSQTRVKIGVSFGEKTTVNGDGSLQFYASQRLKLAKLNQLSQELHGQKHVTGVRLKAKTVKNKIGLPYRECEMDLRFGFGINDTAACLEWLMKNKRFKDAEFGSEKEAKIVFGHLKALDKSMHEEWRDPIIKAVKKNWPEIQAETMPRWSKY